MRKPNFVAMVTRSRAPGSAFSARASSSSFANGPYTSAVSRNVHPSSIARWMVAMDSRSSRSSAVPYAWLIPIRPRPSAETVRPWVPRGRAVSMADGSRRSEVDRADVGQTRDAVFTPARLSVPPAASPHHSPAISMRHGSRTPIRLLAAVALAACGTDPRAAAPSAPAAPVGPATPVLAPPSVASPNVAVGVSVGDVVSFDATRGGTVFRAPDLGALRYAITLEGDANGLATVGATVVGQPAAPGVTWATVTATDALGRSARDRFALVAFDRTLSAPTLPEIPFRYTDAANPLPAHFRTLIDGASVAATDNTPDDNPITDAGAALGRLLFYDRRLSANDELSCAGCHSPFLAFGDTPPLSVGFAGGLTARHTPALTNARFYRRGRFFWDERAATLEEQVLGPIQSPVEMGLTLENLAAKVAATAYYPPRFRAAFGSDGVTSDRVARALAQYVRALVSVNAKYDRALAGAATLTAQERQGEALFRTSGCASCHTTVSQVSDSVHNVGLDATDTDVGAGRGAFKAPSLRNVAARAPYMHDGRFATLAQVVDFFDAGVQPNPNLDPRLRDADGRPRRLGLTSAQKAAMVAFLHTLTDSTFLTAPRFANPFAAPIVPPPSAAAAAGRAHAARRAGRADDGGRVDPGQLVPPGDHHGGRWRRRRLDEPRQLAPRRRLPDGGADQHADLRDGHAARHDADDARDLRLPVPRARRADARHGRGAVSAR